MNSYPSNSTSHSGENVRDCRMVVFFDFDTVSAEDTFVAYVSTSNGTAAGIAETIRPTYV